MTFDIEGLWSIRSPFDMHLRLKNAAVILPFYIIMV